MTNNRLVSALGKEYGYQRHEWVDNGTTVKCTRIVENDCCNISLSKIGLTDGGVVELKAGVTYSEFYHMKDLKDTEKHEFLSLVDNILSPSNIRKNHSRLYSRVEQHLGSMKLVSKGAFSKVSTNGKANYRFEDNAGNVSLKKRGSKVKSGESRVVNDRYYGEEMKNGVVSCPLPVVESAIFSIPKYRMMKEPENSYLRPGANCEDVKWTRPFQISQFTFLTPEQKLSLERENEKLKGKYGLSIERWFITGIDDTGIEQVDLRAMNQHYKRCIDEGYMKFWEYAKDKHLEVIEPEDGELYYIHRAYVIKKAVTVSAYAKAPTELLPTRQTNCEKQSETAREALEALYVTATGNSSEILEW